MTVALSALAARLLSPAELGALFLSFSVVIVAAMAGRMGLEQAGLRLVAESLAQGEYAAARLTILKIIGLASVTLSLVVAAILMGLGDWVALEVFHSPSMAGVSGLIALWVVVFALQILMPEIFRAFQDIKLASIFVAKNIFGGLATGLLTGALMVMYWLRGESIGLDTAIGLVIVSGSVGVVFALVLLIRKLRTLSGGDSVSPRVVMLLRVGIPLLITNLSMVMLMQADILILGVFRTDEEVAIYGASTRVAKLIAMVLVVVNEVISPIIVYMNVKGDTEKLERILRTAAGFAAVPAILVLSGFVFVGGPLLEWLFGPYFAAGSTILVLLGISQVVNAWAGSCGMTLIMTGHQNLMMGVTLITGLLTVAGGIAVAERYGPNGVAAVTSLGLVLQNLAMLVFARVRCGVWTHASLSLSMRALKELWKHNKTWT